MKHTTLYRVHNGWGQFVVWGPLTIQHLPPPLQPDKPGNRPRNRRRAGGSKCPDQFIMK
ncbi:hypothetical protein AA0313_0476 [Acetobacter indonesiensis NRIC 0313]|nr:hypothetical protein AA0313_0476 [Acetobacter indonesiensis NRIC 0313]